MRPYTVDIYVALLTVLYSIEMTTLTSVGTSHGGDISKHCETTNITISYTISNDVADPSFDYSTNVTGPQGQPFIRFMEQAADKNPVFQFSAKYHSGLGYLVHTVNELSGTYNKTYWHLMRAPSERLLVGKLRCDSIRGQDVHSMILEIRKPNVIIDKEASASSSPLTETILF